MPYTRSAYRKEFDSNVDAHIRIIKESKKNRYLTNELKESVLASSVFQVSSAIENYLKDIISNWIIEIKKCAPQKVTLPQEMNAIFLLKTMQDTYNNFLINKTGEREAIKKMISDLSYINKASSQNILQILSETKLVDDRKYPSEKNLPLLFYRIGINNIFDEINKITKSASKLQLKSFMDIRTTIAHSNNCNGLTAEDVINKLNEIKKIICSIDRILFKHFHKNSPSCCWKQN